MVHGTSTVLVLCEPKIADFLHFFARFEVTKYCGPCRIRDIYGSGYEKSFFRPIRARTVLEVKFFVKKFGSRGSSGFGVATRCRLIRSLGINKEESSLAHKTFALWLIWWIFFSLFL